MTRYSKNKLSEKTRDDALKMARATQKTGQTKEQTKLIAQGIQKGIEQFKKRHKEKTRELDKKLNKFSVDQVTDKKTLDNNSKPEQVQKNFLPWMLLVLSWSVFAAYIYIKRL